MTRSPTLSRVVGWLISPALTCWCLAFLIVLTFAGTVYQVEHGLHAAQERFYNSYFLLLGGFLPFPGTQTVLAVLTVNLLGYLVKMLLFDHLKPGIVLTHLGILMLLIGGAITHHYAEESQLTLQEGETSSVSAAYGDWEIAVWRTTGAERDVWAQDADALQPGDRMTFPEPGVTIEVEAYHRNARAFRGGAEDPPLNAMGITRLDPARLEKEPGQNVAGGIFTVHAEGISPLRVLLYGEDTVRTPIRIGGDDYTLALRHKRHPLPLAVTLVDFHRELHAGTQMASSYSSRVRVAGEGGERDVTIAMNKPLRHRGYTLYQASYSELPDGRQSSTFAVARNYGRLIPYVATSVVVIGMIVHFVVMMVRPKRRAA